MTRVRRRTRSAWTPRSAGPAPARLFDLKKVADGIYGAIAKPTAMLNCNAAIVVNRDGGGIHIFEVGKLDQFLEFLEMKENFGG